MLHTRWKLKGHSQLWVRADLDARGGGGGHLGIFWAILGMCRPGLQIGTPFEKKFPLKLIPRSRIRPKTDTPF